MKKAITILQKHLDENCIRFSKAREQILEVFLQAEDHLTIAEIHSLVQKKYANIGAATVYRAMKIIRDSGLASEIDFGQGVKRFEHKLGHKLHDHLICNCCGNIVEFANNNLNKIYQQIAKKNGFKLQHNCTQIVGTCKRCSGEQNR